MKPRGTPIGLKLARSAKAVGQAFSAALADEGGSIPAWLILNALKGSEWRSQRDLARSLGIEGPTLTRHLDGLERARLVRRVADPSDRRVQRLELTEEGHAAHQRMLSAVIRFNRQLHAGLSEAELDQLRRLLDRLVTNVGEQTVEGIPS
jgi:MarR family transcriptional regulator, transcriptional regulator for hemolysin